MIRRSAVAALAVLFLASCEMSTNSPTAPDVDPSAQFAISDGANDGNRFFHFLPPMVKNPTTSGVFDGSADPVVKICEWEGSDCRTGSDFVPLEFSGIQPNLDDQLYQVNWDTDAVEPSLTAVYRIRVYSDAAFLGFADVTFPGRGQAKKNGEENSIALNDGRTLPIKFRIEEGASLIATECDPSTSTAIVDCDVVVVPQGSPGTAAVVDLDGDGGFAAEVRTPAVGEVVFLTLHLLPNNDYPTGDIPQDNQFPYFVDVTAVNASGQSVNFAGAGGAELTLCQADGLTEHDDYDEAFLRLFRVDDGGPPQIWEDFELTDACYPTASQVALLDSHGHPTGHSRFDVLMDRGKRALASLLLPQPLHAVHGGLNGRGIGDFSTWGATLVAPPEPYDLLIDFEDQVPGTPPNPPTGTGVAYDLGIGNACANPVPSTATTSGEIIVAAEGDLASNQFVEVHKWACGSLDFGIGIPPAVGEGVYTVSWRAQMNPGFVGGNVQIRDDFGPATGTIAAVGYGGGSVVGGKNIIYNNTPSAPVDNLPEGEWHLFEMEIDFSSRTTSLFITRWHGVRTEVAADVPFWVGNADEITRIYVSLGGGAGPNGTVVAIDQTFSWDNIGVSNHY